MEPCNQNLSNDKVPSPLSKGTINENASSTGKRTIQNLIKHDNDKLSLITNANNKPIIIKMNDNKSIRMMHGGGDCEFSENQQQSRNNNFMTDNEDSSSTPRLGRYSNTFPNLIIANQVLTTTNQISSRQNSPLLIRQQSSFRYGKPGCYDILPYVGVRPGSETPSQISKVYSDNSTIPSWTSVGLGSTDGKKLIIRKVPTSPIELMNIVNPPSPPEEFLYNQSDDGSDDGDSLYIKPRRQQWSNKLQFVLACVSYSVGLGSVWRFPYLCYKSGGGVFLIPYFIIMIICGVPLLYMELTVGQYTGRGPIGAIGHLCPLLKGTGLASVVISFIMSTYYSVIIAYGIYYFFTSFKPTDAWVQCNKTTSSCWMPYRLATNVTTPAEEFYNNKVLQISDGIENMGALRWELVACLLCAWILIYFAIWKSIKSSAKVRYLTATLPFLLILVFLGKSLTLNGARDGIKFFFKPKWILLTDAKVWINALTQTFNSMGIAFGSMISFASYNKFHNTILHDTLAVSFVNAFTSICVGLFSFATIGYISKEYNTSIEKVVSDGPGLIFILYPQAIAKMPGSSFWAVLFFFMLLCLALNSQFAIVEVVVTSIQDGFPTWIKKNLMCHEMLVFIVCIVSFLFGLPNVTQGGIYFFQLIDHYTASLSIMLLAIFEIIAIGWIYGVSRLCKNVETMNGRSPSLYFKFCWKIAAPSLLIAVWIFYLIDYEAPTYNNGAYRYPTWAVVLGWFITSVSILCVPVFIIYGFLKSEGNTWWEKLRNSLTPDLYECDKCGQHFCEHIEKMDEYDDEPVLVLKTTESNNCVKRLNYTPLSNSPSVIRQTLTNDVNSSEKSSSSSSTGNSEDKKV